MRVLIDGFYLGGNRGFRRYVRELLAAFATHGDPALGVEAVVPEGVPAAALIAPERITYHRCPRAALPIHEQVLLPGLVRRLGPDVLHAPCTTAPLGLPRTTARVVTVHDLIFLDRGHQPGSLRQRIGNAYRRLVFHRLMRRRSTLVAVSETTARDIAARGGRSARPILTPISEFAATRPAPLDPPIDGPYLLHIGGLAPHKNTARTIAAFLAADLPPAVRLVVTSLPASAPVAERRCGGGRVVFCGPVSDGEMATLYRNAAALAFPSAKEGFGLPIVEGFVFGVPVITSDRPPMSEIAGDGAVLVDPDDTAALAAAITRVVGDPAVAADLRRRGATRAPAFSAAAMAVAMAEVYRTAAAAAIGAAAGR